MWKNDWAFLGSRQKSRLQRYDKRYSVSFLAVGILQKQYNGKCCIAKKNLQKIYFVDLRSGGPVQILLSSVTISDEMLFRNGSR